MGILGPRIRVKFMQGKVLEQYEPARDHSKPVEPLGLEGPEEYEIVLDLRDTKEYIKAQLDSYFGASREVGIKKSESGIWHCGYCEGKVGGWAEVEIRKMVTYKTPPPGVRDMRVKAGECVVYRVVEGEFACSKCAYIWDKTPEPTRAT